MSNPVSSLMVTIGGDADQLVAELGRTDKALGRTSANIDVAVQAAGAIALAAAAAGTAIAAMTIAATNNADKMGKMAQGAGLATREFTELVHAAKLSDITAEQLGTSLSRLNRNISDTAAGTGEARAAFAALGIEVKNADGTLKNADQIMMEVAAQFAGMQDGAGKSAIAIQLFGRAGADMIPMLNAGREGLMQMREEARALGVTIDTQTGKSAEAFNDQLTRLGQVQQGLANRLMAELLPAMNQVVDAMVDGAKEGGSMEAQIKELAASIQGGLLVSLQLLVRTGSGVAFVFTGVSSSLAAVAAQLQAISELDFKAVSAMRKAMRADSELAIKEFADFQQKIMNLQFNGPAAVGAVNAGGLDGALGDGPKRPAPLLANEGAASKAGKAQTLLGQQLQEAMDEEMKLMAEISKIMTDYRERERTAEQESYDARNQALIDFYDRQQEEAIRAGQEYLAIERATMTEAQKFEKKSYKDKAKTIFGELEGITAGVAQHNKGLFNLNKVAAISNAIINTHEGISRSLAKYPMPWALAMAAAHAAAGFAQVSAIRSQQFNGGGGGFAASLAASPGVPVTPTGGSAAAGGGGNTLDQTITVQGISEGELFTGGRMRGLIENLLEAQRNGARVVLAS